MSNETARQSIHKAQRTLVRSLHALACDDDGTAYQRVCMAVAELSYVQGLLEPPSTEWRRDELGWTDGNGSYSDFEPASLRGTVAEAWIPAIEEAQRKDREGFRWEQFTVSDTEGRRFVRPISFPTTTTTTTTTTKEQA